MPVLVIHVVAATSCAFGATSACTTTIDDFIERLEVTTDDNIRAHKLYSVAMRSATHEFRRISSLAYSLDLVSIAAEFDEFATDFEIRAVEADVAVVDIIESRQAIHDYVTEATDWELVASLMDSAADAARDHANDATFVAEVLDRQAEFALKENLPSWAADPVITSRLTEASANILTVADGFRSLASLAGDADAAC